MEIMNITNRYYVLSHFSTISSFLITTVDDYLLLQIGAEIIEVRFTNRNEYDDLPSNLRELLPSEITVDLNLQGTLTLSHASQEFSIVDASHRVKLLLGLYYTPLPLQSTDHRIVIPSTPLTSFGNILFLQPQLSTVVGSSTDRGIVFTSLCYEVSEIFVPGIPIISHRVGPLAKIDFSELSRMSFTLVDFLGEPVILKSPLFLTMELVSEHELGAQFVSPGQV